MRQIAATHCFVGHGSRGTFHHVEQPISRARSFGRRPVDYHAHRPGYPDQALRWALAAATREVGQVLDLAAGTGKLTAGLHDLGLAVTAVEPDDGMRGVLTGAYPDVSALAGTAEAIPLPDSAVDAVFVGQAFHWFDRDVALAEIARVLRPGGVLAVLWNGEDPDVEWLTGFGAASETSAPGGWYGELTAPEHESFDQAERTVVAHSMPRTIDSMIDYLGTHSRLLMVDDDERARVVARVRDYLLHRPETSAGEFDLPLVTDVVRLRRR